MQWNTCIALLFIITLMVALTSPVAAATPAGTTFTYQGQLKQSGNPFTGSADLRFIAYDAAIGGSQVGSIIELPAVSISDGVFTVELDFGPIFEGELRFLEIAVRTPPGGAGNYTTLSPRQVIRPAPLAQFALTVHGPSILNLNASNITTGTIPSAALSGTYSSPLNLSSASNTVNGTFTGNGSSITNLNATNLASGTVNMSRFPLGGAWNITSALNLDAGTLFIDPTTNRVGVNTTSPSQALDVNGTLRATNIVMPAQTRVVSIAGSTFVAGSSAMTYSASPESLLAGTTAGQSVAFHANVHLPDNSTVTRLEAYVFDNDAAQNITVFLLRSSEVGSSTMASVTTTSNTTAIQQLDSISIANPSVNNAFFSYIVKAVWTVPATTNNISLRRVEVHYTVTSPLP